jgi:hypothetical protein
VYDRRINGRTLTFGVSGKLYHESLIMYDRETGSLWSHFLGAAVTGPLEGSRLGFIPAAFTDWGTWLREHPGTSVLEEGSNGGVDSFTGALKGTRERLEARAQLDQYDLVLGVLEPAAKAYALRDLRRLGRIEDTIAGTRVVVEYDAGPGTATAYALSRDGGRRVLTSTPVYWFAWRAFFADAPLWKPLRSK